MTSAAGVTAPGQEFRQAGQVMYVGWQVELFEARSSTSTRLAKYNGMIMAIWRPKSAGPQCAGRGWPDGRSGRSGVAAPGG